jgi:hypothetical protein
VYPRVPVELGQDLRTEVVRRAPPAERQAVVRGPLPIDDQVSMVGEGLPPGQSGRLQNDAGNGSVASISEYTGATARR